MSEASTPTDVIERSVTLACRAPSLHHSIVYNTCRDWDKCAVQHRTGALPSRGSALLAAGANRRRVDKATCRNFSKG